MALLGLATSVAGGYYQRALTVVSYIYEGGRWLSVMDQGTLLELRTGS